MTGSSQPLVSPPLRSRLASTTNPDRKGGDVARKARKGSGILEVALVLPVLMITLMAIADLGRYVYATNMMPFLAREGARWASLEANRPSKRLDEQTVSKYVRSLAAGLPEAEVRVETNLEPQLVGVKVTWVFQPVLNVFGGPFTVQGHAAMRRAIP